MTKTWGKRKRDGQAYIKSDQSVPVVGGDYDIVVPPTTSNKKRGSKYLIPEKGEKDLPNAEKTKRMKAILKSEFPGTKFGTKTQFSSRLGGLNSPSMYAYDISVWGIGDNAPSELEVKRYNFSKRYGYDWVGSEQSIQQVTIRYYKNRPEWL